MSYFDQASLVMIPSGYKTSKVYSVKPTDGSGDLAFSRSNDTATRVNSAGLIEKVRTNLVLQSETFNNASWAKTFGASITANTAANPLTGTQTADTIYADATNDFHYISQSITYSAGEATISVYLKANGYSWFVIDSGFSNAFGYFNLTTGAVGTKGSACTTAITSVGSGWYRCSVTFTATASASSLFLSIRNANNGGSFLGDGVSGFFIYGAQAEMGVATNYIATTSAAVSVGPVANVPRLDYLNSSCPRLLLEPQRTNFAIYSENISQSSTTLSGGTVATNVVASPDGMQDADSFTVNTANSAHSGYYEAYNATNGQPFTVSVFAKAGTGRYFLFRSMTNTYATRFGATVDLQTGTILSTYNAGVPAPTGTASKIESYGNGWYRISLTMNAIGSQMSYIWETSNSATPTLDAFLDYSYTGNGTDSYYVWGLQIENGAYATSYIPTLGAAVTRGADACSKTGISSLIGQTEGTVFVDWQIDSMPSIGSYFTFLLTQSSGNIMYVAAYPDGRAQAAVFVGNVLQCNLISSTGFITAGANKFAFGYKANDFVLYANGTQVATDTSGSVPAATAIDLADTSGGKMNYKQALLFKTRLTNAQLAELTTL